MGFNSQMVVVAIFDMSIITFFTLYVRKFFKYLQAPVMHRLNLNQIKVEYVVSFSDALFAFSITFMALSIQIPNFSSNIAELDLTRRLGQLLIPNIIHYIVSFMVVGMYWISFVFILYVINFQ